MLLQCDEPTMGRRVSSDRRERESERASETQTCLFDHSGCCFTNRASPLKRLAKTYLVIIPISARVMRTDINHV